MFFSTPAPLDPTPPPYAPNMLYICLELRVPAPPPEEQIFRNMSLEFWAILISQKHIANPVNSVLRYCLGRLGYTLSWHGLAIWLFPPLYVGLGPPIGNRLGCF